MADHVAPLPSGSQLFQLLQLQAANMHPVFANFSDTTTMTQVGYC